MARSALVALLVAALAATAAAQTNISVCVPADLGPAQLAACTAALAAATTPTLRFTCAVGGSVENCFRLLGDGAVALASASGEQAFTANLDYGVLPILAEGYGGYDDFTGYYSVAVVNKGFCDPVAGPNKTLADLKGLRSAHAGYGRSAGWEWPVGALLASGAMQLVSERPDVTDDAEAVARFFSRSCAPRATGGNLAVNDRPQTTADGRGRQFQPLCTACKGACNSSDPYNDYSGVVRALTERAVDVGFALQTSFINYTAGGTQAQNWSTRPASEFRLLCRNGGCAQVTDYRRCHLARAPPRAIVATPLLGRPANGTLFVGIQDALEAAARNASFQASAARINGLDNFLLTPGTTRLTRTNLGVRGFFEPETLASYKALNQIQNYFNGSGNATHGRLSFCVGSDEELDFCLRAARLLNSTQRDFGWTCRRPAAGAASCAADVANGHTDALVTGASQLAVAYRDFKLRAVAAEDDGSGQSAQYYSVAVVEEAYCSRADAAQGFAGLAGAAICSTGYGRTAGWTMPLGYLLQQGLLATDRRNTSVAPDAEAAARYFGAICAAGTTTDGPVRLGGNQTTTYQPLCTACGNPRTCNSSDRYWSYEGAFRGLTEGACTVAFTKNGIVQDYSTGGRFAQDWAPANVSKYRLLCPGGGCKRVEEYASCTAARVPSRAVAVRRNYGWVRELQTALASLSGSAPFRALVFNSASNPQGHLFQAGVTRLLPVEGDTPAFLGGAGTALDAVTALNAGQAPQGQPLRAASTSSG